MKRALPALLLLLAACMPAVVSPTPGGDAGTLEIEVVAGPVCPVEQDPPDPNCEPRVVEGARILVQPGDGRDIVVGEATTDADGHATQCHRIRQRSYQIQPNGKGGVGDECDCDHIDHYILLVPGTHVNGFVVCGLWFPVTGSSDLRLLTIDLRSLIYQQGISIIYKIQLNIVAAGNTFN